MITILIRKCLEKNEQSNRSPDNSFSGCLTNTKEDGIEKGSTYKQEIRLAYLLKKLFDWYIVENEKKNKYFYRQSRSNSKPLKDEEAITDEIKTEKKDVKLDLMVISELSSW